MVYLLLFGIAFAARAAVGLVFPDPAYPDSYYYVNVARQLADGQGFQVDYIWNFVDVGGRLPTDPQLPIPANAHWMPLAAVVQVPFIWLFGVGPIASALPFWIVGAAAAPLAYRIGLDAGSGRTASIAAGVLTAVPGAVTAFMSQPDNFGLFMTLGALALWLCARGARGDRRAFIAGGVVVGLATLARNDGIVLGAPFALSALADLLRRPRSPRIGLLAATGCLALFAVVVGPWLFRQMDVFGSLSPSAASGRILWITDYRELYSIGGELPTLQSFIGQGVGPLVASRLGGLVSALTIFAVWPLVAVLAPFAIIGGWVRRRDPSFGPYFVYGGLLLALSALLFAVHVPHGTFIHSAVALLPHTYLLAAIGIAGATGWVAQRRTAWDAGQATRFFTVGAVAITLVVGSIQTVGTLSRWTRERSLRSELLPALSAAPSAETLMSPDAGAYRYHAGRRGIVTPDDPLPVIEEAMRAYDVRWLVLERDHMVPALAPVLTGETRPAWLSAPLVSVSTDAEALAAEAAEPTAAAAAADLPAIALYAVCLSPTDDRCPP